MRPLGTERRVVSIYQEIRATGVDIDTVYRRIRDTVEGATDSPYRILYQEEKQARNKAEVWVFETPR